MAEESLEGAEDLPEARRPVRPKRGAFPTPEAEIDAARPYDVEDARPHSGGEDEAGERSEYVD